MSIRQTHARDTVLVARLYTSEQTRFPSDALGQEDVLILNGACGGRVVVAPALSSVLLPPDAQASVEALEGSLQVRIELTRPLAARASPGGWLLLYAAPSARPVLDGLTGSIWSVVHPVNGDLVALTADRSPVPPLEECLAEVLGEETEAKHLAASLIEPIGYGVSDPWPAFLRLPLGGISDVIAAAPRTSEIEFRVHWGHDAEEAARLLGEGLQTNVAIFRTGVPRVVQLASEESESISKIQGWVPEKGELITVRRNGDGTVFLAPPLTGPVSPHCEVVSDGLDEPRLELENGRAMAGPESFTALFREYGPAAPEDLGAPVRIELESMTGRISAAELLGVSPADSECPRAVGLSSELVLAIRAHAHHELRERLDLQALRVLPGRAHDGRARAVKIRIPFREGRSLRDQTVETARGALERDLQGLVRGPCELSVALDKPATAVGTSVTDSMVRTLLNAEGLDALARELTDEEAATVLELWPRRECWLGDARRSARFLETLLDARVTIQELSPEEPGRSFSPLGVCGDAVGGCLGEGLVLGGAPADASRRLVVRVGPLSTRELEWLHGAGWCSRTEESVMATPKLQHLGECCFPIWIHVEWIFELRRQAPSSGFTLGVSSLGQPLGRGTCPKQRE